MTGDKPDERLRTPMQWTASPGAGFTSGTPWEPLMPDWPTTDVAAQQADTNSLLATYRTLIHLRAGNTALSRGDFLPLVTSSDAVAAYLRRDAANLVLVVANVGQVPLSNVTLTFPSGALPAGQYATQRLVGANLAAVSAGTDGSVRGYVPSGTLAPMEAHVAVLSRTP